MFHRSLTEVVTDGFRAPRWVHYLVKVLTGVLVLGFLYPLCKAQVPVWVLASLLSLGWVLTTKVAARLALGEPYYTLGPDLYCDVALHLMPVALLAGFFWSWTWGGLGLAALGLIWALTYPNASP